MKLIENIWTNIPQETLKHIAQVRSLLAQDTGGNIRQTKKNAVLTLINDPIFDNAIRKSKAETHVLKNPAATHEYMRQLWAEALLMYNAGLWSLTLCEENEQRMNELRENYMAEDTVSGMIRDWLDNFTGNRVCTKMIWCEAYQQTGEPDRRTIHEINDIMNNSVTGWIPGTNHRFGKYGIQRSWIRAEPRDSYHSGMGDDTPTTDVI